MKYFKLKRDAYCAPQVDVMIFNVEQGFAISGASVEGPQNGQVIDFGRSYSAR